MQQPAVWMCREQPGQDTLGVLEGDLQALN